MVKPIDGGLTAVASIKAAACRVGIKTKGLDLALVLCDPPATAAGVFTANELKAAPVLVSQAHLKAGQCRAVLINSGNANAGTGSAGLEDARACAHAVASELGCPEEEVLLMSTGIIGVRLPVGLIKKAIPGLVETASSDGGVAAAEAICTTDTHPKTAAVEWTDGDNPIRLGGMAKGAGMIAPNMATMLAVLATDLDAGPWSLQDALRRAVGRSFNRITIDGDMSTNDSVFLLATGKAENPSLSLPGGGANRFQAALDLVCFDLARQIVLDGEGATRLAAITVAGAESEEQADRVAHGVARSLLVKTALYGGDPNWGRILAAVGAAGGGIIRERLDITYGGVPVFKAGQPVEPIPKEELSQAAASKEVPIRVDLKLGPIEVTVLTSDISVEYVRFNAEYTT
jgi:glutamate N-acetyltransferase/amino-acid N-acetyltransferase